MRPAHLPSPDRLVGTARKGPAGEASSGDCRSSSGNGGGQDVYQYQAFTSSEQFVAAATELNGRHCHVADAATDASADAATDATANAWHHDAKRACACSGTVRPDAPDPNTAGPNATCATADNADTSNANAASTTTDAASASCPDTSGANANDANTAGRNPA